VLALEDLCHCCPSHAWPGKACGRSQKYNLLHAICTVCDLLQELGLEPPLSGRLVVRQVAVSVARPSCLFQWWQFETTYPGVTAVGREE
jgi:hypothetical protein